MSALCIQLSKLHLPCDVICHNYQFLQSQVKSPIDLLHTFMTGNITILGDSCCEMYHMLLSHSSCTKWLHLWLQMKSHQIISCCNHTISMGTTFSGVFNLCEQIVYQGTAIPELQLAMTTTLLRTMISSATRTLGIDTLHTATWYYRQPNLAEMPFEIDNQQETFKHLEIICRW